MIVNRKFFYVLMTLAMFGWALSWINAKVLTAYASEYELLFLRNLFSVISFIPILIFTKKYFRISKKNLLLSLVAAVILTCYMKFFYLGVHLGTASLGGSLATTSIPIITFILMAIFFKKSVTIKDIFALFLGATGVLTMINIWSFDVSQIFLPQNIYFIVAAFFWSLLTITNSKCDNISPVVFSFYVYIFSMIIVSIAFIDITQIKYETFDWIFWLNLLSISIISTSFATTIYFSGIEKLGTKQASTFLFLVPPFTIISSVIFLGEQINLSIIIGTILTITALAILNNIIVFKRKI